MEEDVDILLLDETEPLVAVPAPQVRAASATAAPAVQTTVPAQLLQYERDRHIALPIHTTIELLDRPPIVKVPGAAYYCSGLTKWQGEWLPVLDLHVLVHAYRKEFAPKTRYLLIVAYQTAPRQALRHGAIALPAMPALVQVSNASICALPTDSDVWPLIALSSFEHDGRAVPILDTGRLFGAYHG
jgi:CheW-like domain